MRWGPVSLTWGGRVHETGRLGSGSTGSPPTPEQRLAIKKKLVLKAWWKYQAAKSAAAEFWQGSRGDLAFYRDVLEPALKGLDKAGEAIKDADQWDAGKVDELFRKNVPDWMEFRYKVEELRTAYLEKKLME